MEEESNQEKKQLSKRGWIFLIVLMALGTSYSWIDYLTDVFHNTSEGRSPLFLSITFSSLLLVMILELVLKFKDLKFIKILGLVFAIPLLPFFIVGILSQTKLLASLTLPMMALSLLIPTFVYGYGLLEYLELGTTFNDYVIPYLTLTTIAIVFVFAGKHLVKFLGKFISKKGMPQAVRDATDELLENKPFLKIVYGLFFIIMVLTSIIKLGEFDHFPILNNFSSIIIESLVTFVAFDRMRANILNN